VKTECAPRARAGLAQETRPFKQLEAWSRAQLRSIPLRRKDKRAIVSSASYPSALFFLELQ
jgi:hypothetical protein